MVKPHEFTAGSPTSPALVQPLTLRANLSINRDDA
jgi:hypothetical protein